MAAERLVNLSRATDSNSSPLSGATWSFYQKGTLTPLNVYSDSDLGTSLGSVVTADSGGQFPNIYFDAEQEYRGILRDGGGTEIEDVPVINEGTISQLNSTEAGKGAALVKYKRSVAATARSLMDFIDLQPFYPEDYGAVGNANYYNTSDSTWYADSGFSTASTNDSTALQACIDAANAAGGYVALRKRYLVVAQLSLGKGTIRGFNSSQWNANIYGSALCADHSLTSTRGSENDFTNAVLRIDNSGDLVGGGGLHDVAILGNTQNATNHDNRADRCALQGFFWINGYFNNVHISGFSRPAISFVGLCQDMSAEGVFITNCGNNDGTYYAAYEHKPNVSAYGSVAAGRAPNALHYNGWRFSYCPAYIELDHGTSNLGEVDFKGSKIEHRDWQVGSYGTQESPVKIKEGVGAFYWGAGSHITAPVCENSSGTAVWFMDVLNYQTIMDGVTLRGPCEKLLRYAKSGGISKSTRSGSRFNGQVRSASTDAASLDFQNGEIDITVWQDLSTITANTRNGIKIGRGAVLKRADFRAEESCTVNVAAGFLVTMPDGRYEVPRTVTFTGSITSTTLTVSAVSSGTLFTGQTITNAAGDRLGKIVSQASGTTGGVGDYTLDSAPGAVASTTLYAGFAGTAEIQNLHVHDDGSGYTQVNRYYGNTGGGVFESAYWSIGKIVPPYRVVITSAPASNQYDMRRYGDRHLKIDYSGAQVDLIYGASIGEIITLEAGSNAFTLSNNSDIVTSTGANKTVAAGEVVALRMVSGRKAVEISGAPQAATVSDPSGGATIDAESRTAIAAIIDNLQAAGLMA